MTANSFLTSALNVELVYTILTAINRVASTPPVETFHNSELPDQYASKDYSMKIRLSDIKIANPKIWENATQNQFVSDEHVP